MRDEMKKIDIPWCSRNNLDDKDVELHILSDTSSER